MIKISMHSLLRNKWLLLQAVKLLLVKACYMSYSSRVIYYHITFFMFTNLIFIIVQMTVSMKFLYKYSFLTTILHTFWAKLMTPLIVFDYLNCLLFWVMFTPCYNMRCRFQQKETEKQETSSNKKHSITINAMLCSPLIAWVTKYYRIITRN